MRSLVDPDVRLDGRLREGHRLHPAPHVALLAHDHDLQVVLACAPRRPRHASSRLSSRSSSKRTTSPKRSTWRRATRSRTSPACWATPSAKIKPLIQDGSVTVSDINSAERAVEREMLMTIVLIKRGLGVLATVGATAPFVGLLGTTMGIVNAFQGMAVGRRRSRPRSAAVSPKH